jgi:hypothetical protein
MTLRATARRYIVKLAAKRCTTPVTTKGEFAEATGLIMRYHAGTVVNFNYCHAS